MPSMLIKKARIIDPSCGADDVGDILIEDGRIAEIDNSLTYSGAQVINANGLVLAPGLIDMHVHLRDPGYTYKEDILSGCEAAAAGGITTIAAMPNTNPVADSQDVIKYILKASKNAKIKVLPVAAITEGLKGEKLNDFKKLKEAGAIAYSDDGYPVATAKLMSDALKKADILSMPVLAHCEDLSLTDGGIINDGEMSYINGVKGIPVSSEVVGISREIALSMSTGANVHICHVSTAHSVEIIRRAKRNGIHVTAETCPHYFSLNECLLTNKDADYRINPPLRSESDRLAIIEGIIDGTIDVIATDHAPHSIEEKIDFENAPNGTIGLETSLAAGLSVLVNSGNISLIKLINLMSTAPAKILGIEGGSLKIGSPADIVIFDPNKKWTVDVDKMHSKSKNSAFKGIELSGKVKYTICNGNIVYKDE